VRAKGIDPRQVKGLPRFPVINLSAAWTPDAPDNARMAINKAGLYVGIMVTGDATIMWNPVRIPPVTVSAINFCVEYMDLEDEDFDGEALFALHMIYLDAHGAPREEYTRPLDAMYSRRSDGGIYRVAVPLAQIDPAILFTSSLKVTLLSEKEQGSPEKHPVLIRGAWLEVIP
jgi:hypothetical protein